MARSRKRTSDKAKWTKQQLEAAISAVRDGRSVKSVSSEFSIPRTTLRDRLSSSNLSEARLGRKPLFTKAQEMEIAEHVLLLAKMFFGLTKIELRRLAFEIAERKNIPNNFNKIERLAGVDWLNGFLKRNPGISLRKPEATSLNRVTAFNREEVELFYSNVENVMDKHKFSSTHIYNMDETGISTVQKPAKILGPKGQKQVGSVTSWERGKTVTVCCSMSASGNYVPPMFIYPRKRMSHLLEKGGPEGAIYHCSKNGWINEELFAIWLEHFAKNVKPTKEDPVLLILDNHSSHKTLQVFEFCRQNGIVIVSIPPHSSHRLQPLDITFYGPLKSAFNRECDMYMKSHPYEKITPYELASIFNKAYMRVATIEKAVSGFASTGIYPLDSNKFSEDDFAPAASLSQRPTIIIHNEDANVGEASEEESRHLQECENDVPQTSSARDSNSEIEVAGTSSSVVRITDLSPIPTRQPTKSRSSIKSQRNKQHSIILTSTPMKSILSEARDKKLRNTEKKCRLSGKKSKMSSQERKRKIRQGMSANTKKICRPRRNITFESSESESEGLKEDELCDDHSLDDIDPSDNNTCLVCGEFGMNNELWYRCVKCSGWSHSECSGWDSPDGYKCDFCMRL